MYSHTEFRCFPEATIVLAPNSLHGTSSVSANALPQPLTQMFHKFHSLVRAVTVAGRATPPTPLRPTLAAFPVHDLLHILHTHKNSLSCGTPTLLILHHRVSSYRHNSYPHFTVPSRPYRPLPSPPMKLPFPRGVLGLGMPEGHFLNLFDCMPPPTVPPHICLLMLRFFKLVVHKDARAGALHLAILHTIFSSLAPMELLCVTQLSNSWTHDIIWDTAGHPCALTSFPSWHLWGETSRECQW